MTRKLVRYVATAVALGAGFSAVISDVSEEQVQEDSAYEDAQAVAAIEAGHPELVRLFNCSEEVKARARIAKRKIAAREKFVAQVKEVEAAWGKISSVPQTTAKRTRLRSAADKTCWEYAGITSNAACMALDEDTGVASPRQKRASRASKKRPTYRYRDPRVSGVSGAPSKVLKPVAPFVEEQQYCEWREGLNLADEHTLPGTRDSCEFCSQGLPAGKEFVPALAKALGEMVVMDGERIVGMTVPGAIIAA